MDSEVRATPIVEEDLYVVHAELIIQADEGKLY